MTTFDCNLHGVAFASRKNKNVFLVEQCTHIPVIACDMIGITSHYQEQDIKSESENQVNQLLNYSSKTILLIHVLGP